MIGVPNENIQKPKIIMKEIFYQKYQKLLKISGNEELDCYQKYYARQRNQVNFTHIF